LGILYFFHFSLPITKTIVSFVADITITRYYISVSSIFPAHVSSVGPSVRQRDDDVVVLSFPQHLPLKVQHLVLAAAQRDAHHLIRDLHVAVEEASEGDDGPALLVLDAHVSDDPHHLLHLPVDVFLGAVAPLRRLGAVFGPAVAGVALAEALGHRKLVVEVLAKGVEPLARHVLHGPLLPAPLHIAPRGDLNLGVKDGRLAFSYGALE